MFKVKQNRDNSAPLKSNCIASETMTLEQTSIPIKKKWGTGGFGVLFSGIFGLLLTVSITLFILLLFIGALSENATIPDIGFITGDWLAVFLNTWYSFVLGGIMMLIPLLVIMFINVHRIRRAFLDIGCSAIVSAVFNIVTAGVAAQIIRVFSGDWQDVLINTTVAYRSYSIICASGLVIIGVTCLSIYSCIVVIKGGRYEKVK